MIPHIEKFLHQKIERQTAFNGDRENPFQQQNEQIIEQHKMVIENIRSSATALQCSQPLVYQRFEENLKLLYGSCLILARRTPLEFVGSKLDPAYFSLIRAYADGQLDVLESIFSTLNIKVEFKENEKKSLSLLDNIRKWVYKKLLKG